ncbi:MAG: Uma2 family endonuclease [Chloroflexota bacterium]|nr:Uma2 family endonuclease [Chloroflexota bacterium]
MVSQREATIEDLYHALDDGKYELVDGRLVHMSPTGARPGHVALKIAVRLEGYETDTGRGRAFGDNVGFIVNLPRRRSFSPDAAYAYDVEIDTDDFVEGAPIFAVEVRSKGDYGLAKDIEYAAKRAEYFAAGTQVVWDVDPRKQLIASCMANDPHTPRIFTRSDVADAEPALPGWRVSMDELFR